MPYCCASSSKQDAYDEASDLPRLRASNSNTSSRCASSLRRCGLLLVLGLGGLLALCAVLLPVAWFIVVPFFIDTDALAHKYDFEPMKVSAFIGWRGALFGLVPLLTPAIVFGVIGGKDTRLLLLLPIVVYTLMLVIGNALSASRTDSRLAYRSEFAVKFNRYYCDSRTLRLCLDSESDLYELVLLTRGNLTAEAAAVATSNAAANTSTSASILAGVLGSETPTTAALAIWTRCKAVILEAMARETARDSEPEEAAEMEIEVGKIYRFVDACGISRATDAWCGSLATRATPFSDAEHQMLPSPFAANPGMFASYTREWSRRMEYSNVLLGAALGCMVLTAVLLSVADMYSS